MVNYKDEVYISFEESDQEEILINMLKYIDKKDEGSIVEYILDFCEANEYKIEEIADIIKDNKILKNILEQDCIHHKMFRVETNDMDDW